MQRSSLLFFTFYFLGKNKMSSSNPVDANPELPKGALSTTSGKATGSVTVAHVQSSLENIVVISDDESDELVGKEHEVGATPIEGNEKANKDASASNKQSGPLLEDCEVVNRKSSGMRIHEVAVPYFNPDKENQSSQQSIANTAFFTSIF
jgi:hypothetical protein